MSEAAKQRFKVGDVVRIIKIPSDLTDSAGIGTPEVFERALGGTFRVDGINEIGELELLVKKRRPYDTIWIEPEFVELVTGGENEQGG